MTRPVHQPSTTALLGRKNNISGNSSVSFSCFNFGSNFRAGAAPRLEGRSNTKGERPEGGTPAGPEAPAVTEAPRPARSGRGADSRRCPAPGGGAGRSGAAARLPPAPGPREPLPGGAEPAAAAVSSGTGPVRGWAVGGGEGTARSPISPLPSAGAQGLQRGPAPCHACQPGPSAEARSQLSPSPVCPRCPQGHPSLAQLLLPVSPLLAAGSAGSCLGGPPGLPPPLRHQLCTNIGSLLPQLENPSRNKPLVSVSQGAASQLGTGAGR